MTDKIAFFDVDHTITQGATGTWFAIEAVRQGVLRRRNILSLPFYIFLYRYGPVKSFGPNRVPTSVPLLEGVPFDELKQIAETAFGWYAEKRIYPGARQWVQNMRDEGYTIVFATSSFDFIVEPLARELKADHVISTRFEIINGITTGVIEHLTFGPEKRNECRRMAQEHNIPLENCAFFSDSIHDLPLLEEVGRPIAVNPDYKLKRQAKKRGWEVVKFTV